jgi:hypothetical protein
VNLSTCGGTGLPPKKVKNKSIGEMDLFLELKNKSIGEDLFWDTKSEIDFPSLNIQKIADKYKTYIRQICEKKKKTVSVYCKHRH